MWYNVKCIVVYIQGGNAMKKKIISILLTIVMLIGIMSPGGISVFAADGSAETGKYIARTWNSGKVISSEEDIPSNAQEIKTDTNELAGGWYVLSGSLETNTRIVVRGTAGNPTNIVLMDGAVLDAKVGIELASNNVLNIYGQSNDTGTINAVSEINQVSGIGGDIHTAGGTLNVYGGTITATGGREAAGIGGGRLGSGGKFTIYGGHVTAKANQVNGKGIGSGDSGYGGSFTMYGGIVDAAGIDEGIGGTGSSVTVFGGTITAEAAGVGIGGDGSSVDVFGGAITAAGGSAGIGGKDSSVLVIGGSIISSSYYFGVGIGGNNSTVTVNGGNITAASTKGAGIGCASLAINSGTVTADSENGAGIDCDAQGVFIVSGNLEIQAGITVADRIVTAEECRNYQYHHVFIAVPTCSHSFTGDSIDNENGTHSQKCTECGKFGPGECHDFSEGFCTVCGAENTIKYIARRWDNTKKQVVSSEEFIPEAGKEITKITTELAGGWYVVIGTITDGNRIYVNGTADNPTNIILFDGAVLQAAAGIELAEGNVLNIYGQSNDTGAIIASGGNDQAGIGGGSHKAGGTLTVYGGTVSATGGKDAAGIGGGNEGNGGIFTMYGGSVTTNVNDNGNGAGIGGGNEGSGGSFTMYDGTFTATGKSAGIDGSGSRIYIDIYGGTITATGENTGIGGTGSSVIVINGTINAAGDSAGIGGTDSSVIVNGGSVSASSSTGSGIGCGSFAINSGTVTAVSEDGAGIKCSNIVLNSGTVTAASKNSAAIDYSEAGTFFVSDALEIKAGDTADNSRLVTLEQYKKSRTGHVYIAVPTCEHSFTGDAIDNGNGTHSQKCTKCGEYGPGVAHIFENNFCTVCEAENEKYLVRSWDASKKQVVSTEEYIPIDAKEITKDTTDLSGGWYVVSKSITNGNRINVNGTADNPTNIVLFDGAEFVAPAGIELATDNVLNIYGQSNDTGTIIAAAGKDYAGIGSHRETTAGALIVYGGTITSTGGTDGAGIGGGYMGNGGNFTMYGGSVTANSYAAGSGKGIGSGFEGNGGSFTMYGGIVDAAGINEGIGGTGSSVTVFGGTITAEAVGVGIGGTDSSVAVSGGTITATGGSACIGGTDSSVIVNGGSITVVTYLGAGIGGGSIAVNGGTVNASCSNGVGIDCSENGNFTLADSMHMKAGDTDADELVTLDEYLTLRSGYVYIAPHDFTDEPIDNGNGTHSQHCPECGAVTPEEKHIFVNGICTVCGAEQGTYINLSWDSAKEQVISSKEYIPLDAGVITGNAAALSDGWYVVNGEVTVDARITVSGDVSLILKDGCKLTLKEGLEVSAHGSLSIYGQAEGTGELITPKLSENVPAIGVGTGAELTVHGGKIYAYGGNYAAGIGGGYRGDSGDVTVYGGSITAYGGANGAGIGGGDSGAGGTFTIYGGKVDAHGSYSSGIGGGQSGAGGTIIINGGKVGSGGNIGSGYQYDPASGSTVVINGGTVSVTGDNSNIGGNGSTVEINGGEVKIAQGTLGVGYNGSNCNITIRGGTINSFCYYYPAVGGTANNVKINIYGGSIKAESHSSDAIVATSVTVNPDKCERFTVKDFSGNELTGSPITAETDISGIISENKQVQIEPGVVHTFTGDYVDNGDGTYSKKCIECDEVDTENKITATDYHLITGTCDSNNGEGNMMGRQTKIGDESKGRVIIPVTLEQLEKIGDKLVIVGGDFEKETTVEIDCAYTYFYDGETKIEAKDITVNENGDKAYAFIIIDCDAEHNPISGYGYYRLYNNSVSTENFLFDVIYADPKGYDN